MSASTEIESLLQELFAYLSDTFAVNLSSACALTWLVYDIALTFGDEVKYVWGSKWTIIKVLYFLSRYYILLSLILHLSVNTNTGISVQFCKSWFWFRGFNAPWMSTMIAESLFAFRIWAMYGRSTTILILVFSAMMIDATMSAATIVVDLKFLVTIPRVPGFSLPGCLATTGPNHMELVIISWTATLALSFLYFMLTLYKLWYRPNYDIGPVRSLQNQNSRFTPLATLMLRDGALYFFIIFAAVFLNFMFNVLLGNRAINQMAISWLMAAYSVLSCRLVLNLRAQFTSVSDETTISNIRASFRRHKAQLDDSTGTTTEDMPLESLHPIDNA